MKLSEERKFAIYAAVTLPISDARIAIYNRLNHPRYDKLREDIDELLFKAQIKAGDDAVKTAKGE